MQISNLVGSRPKKVYFYPKNATFHADGLKTADKVNLTNARWSAVERDDKKKTVKRDIGRRIR